MTGTASAGEIEEATLALEAIVNDAQAIDRVCAYKAEVARLNQDGDIKRLARIDALADEFPPASKEAVRLINKHAKTSPDKIVYLFRVYSEFGVNCPPVD